MDVSKKSSHGKKTTSHITHMHSDATKERTSHKKGSKVKKKKTKKKSEKENGKMKGSSSPYSPDGDYTDPCSAVSDNPDVDAESTPIVKTSKDFRSRDISKASVHSQSKSSTAPKIYQTKDSLQNTLPNSASVAVNRRHMLSNPSHLTKMNASLIQAESVSISNNIVDNQPAETFPFSTETSAANVDMKSAGKITSSVKSQQILTSFNLHKQPSYRSSQSSRIKESQSQFSLSSKTSSSLNSSSRSSLVNSLSRTDISERNFNNKKPAQNFNQSLRWDNPCDDPVSEEKRIQLYKLNQRKRYLAAANQKYSDWVKTLNVNMSNESDLSVDKESDNNGTHKGVFMSNSSEGSTVNRVSSDYNITHVSSSDAMNIKAASSAISVMSVPEVIVPGLATNLNVHRGGSQVTF